MPNRRTFATRALTASLAASLAPNLFTASANRVIDIRLGFIGVGGRGTGVLKTLRKWRVSSSRYLRRYRYESL